MKRNIVIVLAAIVASVPALIGASSSLWEVVGELGRCLLIAGVVAHFVFRAHVAYGKQALALASGLCAFEAAILLGAVIHEHLPLARFATECGYAFASTGLAVAVTTWRASPGAPVAPHAAPMRVHIAAVIVAAIAAIVLGAVWYSPLLFGAAWSRLAAGAHAAGAKVGPVEGLEELARSAMVGYVIARFAGALDVAGWKSSMRLGATMWLGFHVTLLLFSFVHGPMRLALFAIHAGHGLANDMLIATLVGWRRARART